MKASMVISIAMVTGVLAGQAVTADPIARNHPRSRPQQPQNDAQQGAIPEESSIAPASASSDISRLEREYLADGVLTTTERNELDKRAAAARRSSSVQQ
jgi:hypothetical protein